LGSHQRHPAFVEDLELKPNATLINAYTQVSEDTVMRKVIPLVAGSADIPKRGHLPFTNFESLTNKDTVMPVPDYFDGARMRDVYTKMSNALRKTVITIKHTDNRRVWRSCYT
jgi:hypothetical protein